MKRNPNFGNLRVFPSGGVPVADRVLYSNPGSSRSVLGFTIVRGRQRMYLSAGSAARVDDIVAAVSHEALHLLLDALCGFGVSYGMDAIGMPRGDTQTIKDIDASGLSNPKWGKEKR